MNLDDPCTWFLSVTAVRVAARLSWREYLDRLAPVVAFRQVIVKAGEDSWVNPSQTLRFPIIILGRREFDPSHHFAPTYLIVLELCRKKESVGSHETQKLVANFEISLRDLKGSDKTKWSKRHNIQYRHTLFHLIAHCDHNGASSDYLAHCDRELWPKALMTQKGVPTNIPDIQKREHSGIFWELGLSSFSDMLPVTESFAKYMTVYVQAYLWCPIQCPGLTRKWVRCQKSSLNQRWARL